MKATIRYIDLFAGAGGLSEGFYSQGFIPVAHVEYDKAACFTLKTRLAFHFLKENGKIKLYYKYLKGEINRTQLYSYIPENVLKSVINAEIGAENKSIFDSIDNILQNETVDLIIGGPPCQAYSVVGRAPLKHKKDDERTRLYVQYGRFLKKYSPKMFVFENVPGILSAANGQYFRNLQSYYKRLGYKVEAQLLNSFDYGVVQHRQRVIIIGWKKELDFSYPTIPTVAKNYRDSIFSDLPLIKPGERKRIHKYRTKTNDYLQLNAIRNGIDFVTQHIARPHNEKDLMIYRLAIDYLEQGQRLKNDQIPEEMRTQKNISDFLDRFKVVDNEPHTMIAHIAKDGHHFIHPDKKQLRSISVREAARIQSFPDNFYFEGIKENQPRTSAFKQIGNAVPPLMAERIAEQIKSILDND
ncbi:DNA (cytosine-5)-methyltransferase 1 [Chryseobacterium sp. H1D6B]|uniref:DNA cytosine methyltransferase n=1 Tax=Chryseobacterium sp. H1D6B TaxID=2940588 RepID=UPI0015C8CD3E|nr:DNA cytosine methyltransferase [Chryseobacterium sp. H1D6B]MDH6253373.1 DNA (cytosine-5)-methyltransferase 1 [Chryseobacterium sp. H1D6B]